MLPPKERRPGPGRPRDEELPARRRAEIVRHSIDEFARNGYNGADLDVIAMNAGCSKGTLYNYFPSKGALFNASVDHVMFTMIEASHAEDFVDPTRDAVDQLEQFVHGFIEHFHAHPQYVELLVQERSDFRDREEPTFLKYRTASRERWLKRFEELMECGRMRRMSTDQAVNGVGDLLYGTIFNNYFRRRRPDPKKQAREVVDLLMGGLLTESEFSKRQPKAD